MDNSDTQSPPSANTKTEFARRLYRLILDRGWRQAEFARRADVQRSSLTAYLKGDSLPTALNVQKMAKALDIAPNDLLPTTAFYGEEPPEFEVKALADGKTSQLRVDMVLPTSVAMQVLTLLTQSATKNVVNGD